MQRPRRSGIGALGACVLLASACGDASDGGGGDGGATLTGGPLTSTSTPTSAGDTGQPTTGGADGGGTTTGSQGTGDTSSESGTTGPAAMPGPWDHGVHIPAEPQAPGDPAKGYDALLTKGYITCGIPWLLWGLAKPLLGNYANGEPMPGRPGKNAEVPHNWTVHKVDGAEIVSQNCLQCHAGHFNGQLVLGLGTAEADYTEDMSAMLKAFPIPNIPIPGLEQMTRLMNRYKVLGPQTVMRTVGTNPAEAVAITLVAHRDRHTLEWHDEALLDLPNFILPSDPPPWWRAHKKNGLFYNGMARADHRGTMMFASSLCTDSVAEASEILSYFHDINAYIRSLRPPKYPFAIDAALAEQGAGVFAASCAGCHGTYDEDEASETYPNLLFPLHVIGTDPTLAEAGAKGGSISEMVDWFNGSYYGQLLQLITDDPFPGYVAPPLDGVWATAPYLHNGSVPNLDVLLDSPLRPTYWKRIDLDSGNYDQAKLGWPILVLPYGQDGAPDDERKYIYDTSKPGHANTGHPFGDHLTDGERAAVLEYIKTI